MKSIDRRQPAVIHRYTAGERTNHWIVAFTFVLLALSGLALFHPSMYWLSALFGGGTWTRILHPFLGVLMFVAFLILAARFWHHNLLSWSDREWLRHANDVLANREEAVPDVGRYNGGQKVLFFVMVACLVLLLLSGIVIWRSYFSAFFPLWAIRLAAVVHAICAFGLICGIIVHIYAAVWVKGSVQAMTRGTVTPGWAWKHHRAWFRENFRPGDKT